MSEENKTTLANRLWRLCLRSPVSVLAVVLLAYYGFLAFVLEKDPFLNKTIMLGIVFLWGVWFFLKNIIKILLIVAIIGCGAYGWYRYANMDRIKCEESGRVWNEATQTCEEKLTFWEEIQNKWEKFKKSAIVIEKTSEKTKKDLKPTDKNK